MRYRRVVKVIQVVSISGAVLEISERVGAWGNGIDTMGLCSHFGGDEPTESKKFEWLHLKGTVSGRKWRMVHVQVESGIIYD